MFYIPVNRLQQYMKWVSTKLYLDSRADKAKKRNVKRGKVYMCNFGRGVGSEQDKERPCVVIQNFHGNKNSPNTIVAPITHTTSTLDIVVPITEQKDANNNIILSGNVLLGNVITVSKARLGDEITELPKDEMKKIDIAIAKSLDIFWRYERMQKSLNNLIDDKQNYINKLKMINRGLQDKINEMQEEIDKLKTR